MARKFLYLVVVLIVLAIVAAFTYAIWGQQLLRLAMIPAARFEALPPAAANAYSKPEMWFARPDKPGNPALWVPAGQAPQPDAPAAVFFIHPTSYLDHSRWNSPLDDAEANARAELFLRGQASAFNAVGQVWAPRYRQATFGAFLTSADDAKKALDLAYGDVALAFDAFVAANPDRPIILAGHSQGALHLTRLLREKVAGKPLARQIVAAYVVGWPVSKTADLPALGMPECTRAEQAGCLLSWQSFAEPADPALIWDAFDATAGPTGLARRGTPVVCTNPLTGTAGAAAPARANAGTLLPNADMTSATLVVGAVPARCNARGLLLIGKPPQLGGYVLPGNNYHVYDYSLFWANVRHDARTRLSTLSQTCAGPTFTPLETWCHPPPPLCRIAPCGAARPSAQPQPVALRRRTPGGGSRRGNGDAHASPGH